MKLGITGNTFGRFGENRYQKMAEIGFRYTDFDLAGTDSAWYTADEDTLCRLVKAEKQLCADAGVTINQVHGPWRWPPQDNTPEDRAERMEKMKHSIRVTAMLGCKNWVIHPIMPFGIDDLDTGKAKETWDLNVTFMRELLSCAKEYDLVICFENMPMVRFSLATPTDILRFVNEMNDEHFQVCLDTGHVNVFPSLTLGGAVRELGSTIRVMHVHDNDGKADRHQLPYIGTADWEDFGRALHEIGYDGVFSYETSPWGSMPDPVYEAACRMMVTMAETITMER
ncbi:MAG: sugar phosphate isomerase/epimerase [Clostridia bacterium]|nr:sugar phosphate isomerase/epimerase [Clostridia bacterium]